MEFPTMDLKSKIDEAWGWIDHAQGDQYSIYFQENNPPKFAKKWDEFMTRAKDALEDLLEDETFKTMLEGEEAEESRLADLADANSY